MAQKALAQSDLQETALVQSSFEDCLSQDKRQQNKR